MTEDEIRAAIAADPALQALVPDAVALAAALSAGRTRVQSRMISTRGMREGPRPAAQQLIAVLRAAETAPPAWLSPALSAAGIPEALHASYADDLASAYAWLQGDGLDIGSPAVRPMLDLIAVAQPDTAPACAWLKGLAEVAAPVSEFAVRVAIYNDDGSVRV